jgi:pectate lyase
MNRAIHIAAALAVALAATFARDGRAQLVAFPGAEGAGSLATGGRGGDVYRVTNLNNTGAGSLRNGITGATAAGRTIVFDVAGTINLTSALSISGKSKVTIAGQTAPAGGITIANHALYISNSNNVVVQHLRVRPGNTYGSSDPDAIGVTGSNNVMIDHVTTSWGVDETISVTHSSNNVTVQWSTISQGLLNGGHSEGPNHSFSSLLNGGTYSFHHNLYTNTRSRQPRPQWNEEDARHLALDWVNNVLYNPGDRFGYSDEDDEYTMNIVGNYAIKGPQTSNSNNYVMVPADVDSQFYAAGNYMDSDRDLVLDGVLLNDIASGSNPAVFSSGLKTIVGSRFDIPAVTTQAAEQAYIQVMSRAGAIRYRDSIDKRMIRTVLNHLPGHIQTQADWGGWPTLPTGAAAPDANGDGVPNDWAIANGFSTTTALNTAFAPDGYTYLEKYLHSLTPNAFTPTGTTSRTISTAFGAGADAQVNENGGASAVYSGNGAGSTLDAQWSGAAGAVNQAILMRFDISQVVPGSLTAARLDLTAASAITGSHTFMVYAVEQDAADWNWTESTVDFASAPGLALDAGTPNSGTLGVNNTSTTTSHPDNPDVLTLGQITIPGAATGDTISLTNPNLAVFLNLAAYYQGEASEDVVTLILQQTTSGSAASFYSKEGNPALAPRLVIDALYNAPSVFDVADFNGDGVVSAADLANWKTGFGAHTGAGRRQGDADLDGDVDGNDFLVWQQRLGNGSPVLSASNAVPEPTAIALAGFAVLAAAGTRRHSRAPKL